MNDRNTSVDMSRDSLSSQSADYAAELAEALRAPALLADKDTETMLLIRLGTFRLALPCKSIVAITCIRPICSIPHRRKTALLGLTSFAGDIIPACSLARILGVADRAGGPDARTLVLTGHDGPQDRWGVPVDAVLRVSTGRRETYAQSDAQEENLLGVTWSNTVLVEPEGQRTEILDMPTVIQRLRRSLN